TDVRRAAAVILGLVDGVSLQLTFDPTAFGVAEASRFCGEAVARYLTVEVRAAGRHEAAAPPAEARHSEGDRMSSDTIEAAKAKAREYFATRGTLAPAGALRERIAEAFESLETFLDTVPAAAAARTAIAGEWTIHEIVDHLVETHRPGLDELW